MPKFFLPLFLIMCAGIWLSIRINSAYFTEDKAVEMQDVAESESQQLNAFRPDAPGPDAAVLKKREDRHFWANAKVNNVHVEFMVDTGASSVALTPEDARRLGFTEDDLNYDYDVYTAGGKIRGAFVRLDEIQIGRVTVENVGAMVIESDLQQSLLGMSFMNELSSYEVRKSSMIIRE